MLFALDVVEIYRYARAWEHQHSSYGTDEMLFADPSSALPPASCPRRVPQRVPREYGRCIIKATGASAARARQELEEAYLDPIEAILNIKCPKFKNDRS